MGLDVVTLSVSPSETKFVVHKDLLTRESPYFSAMFKGTWKEASMTEPVVFPDANEELFSRFLDWLSFRCPLQFVPSTDVLVPSAKRPATGSHFRQKRPVPPLSEVRSQRKRMIHSRL